MPLAAFVQELKNLNHQRLQKRRGRRIADRITDISYDRWIAQHDDVTPAVRSLFEARLRRLTYRPCIAVVMPVFNPRLEWLQEAIASVRRQIYPHWQLCIADDASTDPAVRKLLKEAAQDPRICVAFREANGHISACSNSALALADADYVGFLDHDDVLREHALLFVAEALNVWPKAELVYSDEDKLSPSGNRCEPYFKPDWSPELLLGQNYLCHFTVIRKAVVDAVGGFRAGFEGAQDHDLVLRCTERIAHTDIVHIPHVLYHWRQHSTSTALHSAGVKDYAVAARQRAVREHLERRGQPPAMLLTGPEGWCEPRWQLTEGPKVSIVIPTRDGFDILETCVESILRKTAYRNFEIVIVDNGSSDPKALRYIAEKCLDPRVRSLRDDQPFNYSALNNRAVSVVDGDYLALVNNDVEVISEHWLGELMAVAMQPDAGAVGARLWYGNLTLQHGGVVLGVGGVAGHSHKFLPQGHPGYMGQAALMRDMGAVTGACLVVKKSKYDEVGGLDEGTLAVAFNDVDFCLRLRAAGYRNIWVPGAELFHHESVSRGSDAASEKRQRFLLEVDVMKERWGPLLRWDPAYNPNLTLDREDHGLAEHPRVSLSKPWYDTYREFHPARPATLQPPVYHTELNLTNKNDSHTQIYDHVVQRSDLPLRSLNILDVGCSTGVVGRALQALGHRVTGIEPSATAVTEARRHLEAVHLGNIESFLAEKSASVERFDVVILADVLEHLVDPRQTLLALKGLLHPCGQLVMSVPNTAHASVRAMTLDGHWNYTNAGLLDHTHLRFFTRKSLIDLLTTTVYRIDRMSATTATSEMLNRMFSMRLTPRAMFWVDLLSQEADRNVVQYVVTAAPAVADPASENASWLNIERVEMSVEGADNTEFSRHQCLIDLVQQTEARGVHLGHLSSPKTALPVSMH